MGYTFTKNTTDIEFFWGDMHTFSIRADKVLKTREDMLEVVSRFEADKSLFDYTDYFEHANFHKAAREYTVLVTKRVQFDRIVFSFEGKIFNTKTTKWSVIRNIRDHAEEILEHKQIQAVGLVDDATGELLGVTEVVRELDKLAGEDLLPF